MAKHKFLKTVLALGTIGVASKAAYDKYKEVKAKFEQEESESQGFEVKNYNAIFQSNKVVEVDDEEFTGCEVKAIGSKIVIDLGLAVFEKDVYVDLTSVASSVTIVLPEGVNAACDVEKRVSAVTNLVQNTDEDGIHTVYIIGKADASKVEVVPVDFYVDSDDDFEDFVDEESENDDLENVENPEDEEDLRKMDGAIELTVEEVEKK
jgi:hypothetical protein